MPNLHEHTKNYLIKVNELPSLVTMSAQEAREMRAKAPKLNRPAAKFVTIKQQAITMRDGHKINIRIYIPNGHGPFDIIVYYHGGGWVLNDLNTCHESCSYLAQQTNQIVVSVEYRLAPEFKFPIPVFDAFDSFLWVNEHASSFDGNAKRISVAGDSAGGNLAVAVSQLAAQKQLPITSQILLYPVTDLSYNTKSYSLFKKGFGLDRDVMQWFGDSYISSQIDANNPLVSPLQLTNFTHFPPTIIFAAENDVLRDEALEFDKKLQKAGVQTKSIVMEGLVHSYFTHNEVFELEIHQTIELIDAFLKQLSEKTRANN
ncbi:alpha/beta hydrolase fold domain-containing protein [Solibacillus sp. MA9]|uniref:Alpha/beta hydrolase fold domain-containing protein n=1 Tax=Solibacillus palustris TaxID=2908203 RepID=A0ABS9UCJ8_9BACL|nr:alpha/beta hydrolase [Solibacillus sp. MA9]MCH7322039.1 alpha/beta hydrolase fold domain-containing protein [Solibacillus sp. MA9]